MLEAVVGDRWVRGWLALGGVLLSVATIVSIPWSLWVGWGYLGLVCVLDASRDRAHSGGGADLWHTRSEE